MPEFTVVNPILRGSLKIKYEAKDASAAAEEFWKEFSKLIVNFIQESEFTLKNGEKHYHFKVTEEKDQDDTVRYDITELKIDMTPEEKERLVEANKMADKHDGGGFSIPGRIVPVVRKVNVVSNALVTSPSLSFDIDELEDDSSSSSSSSSSSDSVSDVIHKFNRIRVYDRPIRYYHYIPSIYKLTSVNVPVFTYPIAPFIKMDFSTAWFH